LVRKSYGTRRLKLNFFISGYNKKDGLVALMEPLFEQCYFDTEPTKAIAEGGKIIKIVGSVLLEWWECADLGGVWEGWNVQVVCTFIHVSWFCFLGAFLLLC